MQDIPNQSPPYADVDLYGHDRALQEAMSANGAGGEAAALGAFGRRWGSAAMFQMARLANEFPPRLKIFDAKGHRSDTVEFHPAYHHFMAESVSAGLHASTWQADGTRAAAPAEVARAARFYMVAQVENGHMCPVTMTLAAVAGFNREARERLLTSFEIVNGHFKRLFTELFGGGEAALHLIESDDPLEAGLEIIAKPPGKKPQTLSLLSGGEQALTALALIFAVFLTNPSPICVLDEVDAPLDDHNVERFCTLLHEMTGSTETRFVIITHNPITMARMNRLFGVTMAERGVSQLVSVDLEDAVKILDQNVA